MITEDFVVTAPKLLPFTPLELLSCPICGARKSPTITRWWIALLGQQPAVHSISYCPGGRARVEDIGSPIEAMMRGSSESRPLCGGVVETHLHLKCRVCGYNTLMRTKS